MSKLFRNLFRVTAVLVSILCLFGVSAAATGNPVYTGAQGSIDMERGDLDADVSCMTFNVLHYVSSAVQDYASSDYDTRRNYAVTLIEAYDPDIIGMQEAGDDSAHTENWPDDLASELGDTYTPIILTDQTDDISQMYITAGLIIWYRTSRFELLDSGAESYGSCSVDCATADSKRWFQWAKLYDTQEDKVVFVFNTHLSTNHSASTCSVCTSSAEGAAAGRVQRTNELAKLSAKIQELAQGYPCFVTGDFNCTMSDSLTYESDTTKRQLLELSAGSDGALQSALVTADLQITSEGNSSIDHVFLNTNFLRARKLVGIQESVGGYIGSDHMPYIAYCDYRAAAQIGPGAYDEVARTYTDSTDSNQYTFEVTPADGFTYQIYKDTGTRTGDTIWSVKDTSRYEICFYDPSGALYSVVDATICATSAAKPTLTSTGLNQYFANHAYHVIADGESVTVTPVCSGSNTAALYRDEACTDQITGGTITGLSGGRTTYYLKHDVYKSDGTLNFSEVFPLYVYRETAEGYGEMALYVDQNIGDATGTVAFFDGTDVRLVEGQVTGFSSLSDVQPTVNTADGYSIYMAPGVYEGNEKSFTKSFRLYGVNWETSPNLRGVEGTWTLAERPNETVIDGQVLVSLYGDDVDTKSVAIQGITFTGETKEGSIYVIENRGGTGSSYWEANSAYTIDLEIRNNIFKGWSTQSSSADINLNCASRKSGVIAGNYFSREVGRSVSSDTSTYPLTYNRAIFGRNINGLLIDSNRFANYDKECVSLTAEIGYGTTLPGYAVYTVQDNRFENCVSTLNRICNITSATRADVRYLGNYFIRCGYGTAAVYVDATETTGTTTNYHYCDLTVLGNKFYECERSFGIFRNGTSLNGYFNAMGLTISQNVFHNPCERAMQPKNGYTSATATSDDYTYSQQSYNHSTIYFRIANASQSTNGVASAWDLSHNYFYSARLAEDFANPHHPSLYINSYMKEWTNGAVSAEYECMNFTLVDGFLPCYTNHGCTNASSTDSTDTAPTSSAVSAVSGITAEGWSGVYDGAEHSISVTVPEGAFVSYSYNDSAAAGYKSYSAENPGFTEPGNYTVTYRVIAPGCKATYGTAVVTIEEPVSEPELFDIAYASMTMGNSLAINFAFEKTELEDWTGCCARIVKSYADNREDMVETVAFTDWKTVTINGVAHYYVTFNGVAAKEMTDDIRVTIFGANGEAISNVWTDSVKAQSMRIIDNVSDLEKTMIVDMLNYGAAAQEFFGYSTDRLANADLSGEQQGFASEAGVYEDRRSGDENYYASNVNLESNIQLMFAFRNVNQTMRAEISFTDHWGVERNVTIAGSDFQANGSFYVITAEDLVVADGRADVTCRIFSGDTLVSEATDSLESYTARKGGSDELYIKMMQYSDSAYAYFH